MQLSLAPLTRVSYSRAVKHFLGFCERHGWQSSWPVSLDTIMHFLVHWHHSGLVPATIAQKLAALSFTGKTEGFPDICVDFKICRTLQGWTRCHPRVEGRHRLISPKVLYQVLDVLPGICCMDFEVALFRASFWLAFFGALRINKLVARPMSDSSRWALQLADIECLDAGV